MEEWFAVFTQPLRILSLCATRVQPSTHFVNIIIKYLTYLGKLQLV